MSALQSKTIIVVDDDPDLREALGHILNDEGATPIFAEDGEACWKILSSGAQVDAILSDMRMPNGGGQELLRRVRNSDSRTIPLIIATGYSDISRAQLLREGAFAILSKPFQMEALIDTLSRAVSRKSENE